MPKLQVGFIVDGPTEVETFEACLNAQHHEFHMRKNNLNGRDASLDRIAKATADLLRALSKKGTTFNVVVIDKEERPDLSCDEMRSQLESKIGTFFKGHFVIFVVDIMFENWIIADFDSLKRNHSTLIQQTASSNSGNEGKNGCGILKKYWRSDSSYKKTVHGPILFKSTDKKTATKHSVSFQKFFDFLKTNKITLY